MRKRQFVCFALVAAGLGTAAPAMADWKKIVNVNSGLCLGVTEGIMQPNQPIIQWPCNGSPDQLWWVPSSGSLSTEIQNSSNSNYCLSVPDNGEGSQLTIQSCGGASRGTAWEEWWEVTSFVSGCGVTEWVLTSQDGYVAAVSGASLDEGTGVIQWQDQIVGRACTSHTEQQWSFE